MTNPKIQRVKYISLLGFNLKVSSKTIIISGNAISLIVVFKASSEKNVRQEIVPSENTLIKMS